MKHICDIDHASIQASLLAIGVRATDQHACQLWNHLALVLDVNTRMNLTRITSPADALRLHIVDSLAFLQHTETIEGPVLDLGSGAGYPGIPLAILGYNVTLCESVRKKALFLTEVAGNLALDVKVEAIRAEELALERPSSFHVTTARAVSSLSALVELSSPLLVAGGRLISLKGRLETAERAQAERAAVICGMSCSRVAEYQLPSGENRTMCEYVKIGPPRIALPRRPGMAQRQPLGSLPT